MDRFKHNVERAVRYVGKEGLSAKDQSEIIDVQQSTQKQERATTWQRIEEIQKEKRALVQGYMEWRKKSWNEKGARVNDRTEALERFLSFEERQEARTLRMGSDGSFEMPLKGGEKVPLSKGEIFAAAEWGFWWKFDSSVPRELQREVMSHQVHYMIAEKYDKQLIALGKSNSQYDDKKRDTYARIEQTEKTLEVMPAGILAEKMLMSFLTKEMHDGNLPFTVAAVDIYEDVEHKIDFVITVADARRGVRVGEPEHHIGIQFTTNPHATEKKHRQLERMKHRMQETEVDEIVLVTMPLNDVRNMFDQWRYTQTGEHINQKKLDPRGPDHLWSTETKKSIVDHLLRGIGLAQKV